MLGLEICYQLITFFLFLVDRYDRQQPTTATKFQGPNLEQKLTKCDGVKRVSKLPTHLMINMIINENRQYHEVLYF